MKKLKKNTVLSTSYGPPDGDFKAFNTFLEDLYSIFLNFNNFFMLTVTLTLTFLIILKMKKFQHF